jgi:hypothetical protein
MLFRSILAGAAALAASVVATPAQPIQSRNITGQAFSTFNNNVIYQQTGKNALYARLTELADGTLLVACTLSGFSPQFFPVFSSQDGGLNWRWISNITDQVNGWGMPAQPALLELRESLAGYEPGAIFASGNSWSNSGTRIDLYVSTNKAQTWKFVSHIAQGGRPNTTNGATPVWEPLLM